MNPSLIRFAAQADLVLLTADMLRPPLPATTAAKWWSEPVANWEECLRASGLPDTTNSDNVSLRSMLREVFTTAEQTSVDEWSDEYWRLFDGPTLCPINQASYDRRDKGTILGDLAGFYQAFGWNPTPSSGERPDHLRFQLEFLAVLLAMASQTEDSERSEIVSDGLRQFARIHMQDWVPSFSWQLCEVSRVPLFGAIGTWIVMLWDGLSQLHQWSPELSTGKFIKPERDGENPYECAAHGLLQLGTH
ncbi:MAG: molecular chaperone TorD family protein [Pirellulaceae bacterium]|nr:molecular chaperone TorD family protein [Pirellulaceae bacterium]